MTTIKRYTTSNSSNSGNNTSPKGSMSNPYTVAEYEAIPDEEWKGGYVEGMGYVRPIFEVIGSYPSNAYSDNYSDWLSDWNWGEYSHPFSHMGSTPEPGGGGGNGGNNQNPNTPNPDGQTGGGNGNTQQPIVSERIKNMIEEASTFSPEVSRVLHNLMKNGKVIEVNNNSIKGAQWNATNGILTIGPDANASSLWHEMVHYYQYSPKGCSHAVREWQAYLIAEIMRCCVSPVYPSDKDPKIQLEITQMFDIKKYSGLDSKGIPTIDKSIVDYLETLNCMPYVKKAMEYWKEVDKENDPPLYKHYYDWYDTDYDWNWESIIKKLGIQIRE